MHPAAPALRLLDRSPAVDDLAAPSARRSARAARPRPCRGPPSRGAASSSRIRSARSKSRSARAASRSARSSSASASASSPASASASRPSSGSSSVTASRAPGTGCRLASPISSKSSASARGVLKSSARASRKASRRRCDIRVGAWPRRLTVCRTPRAGSFGSARCAPADSSSAVLGELERLAVVAGDEEADDGVGAVVVDRRRPAGRCCRPTSTSSRRRSRPSRCASRPGRSGSPRAASDCAISFSWWGKTRSEPPPWIANSAPSSASAIAEHSMCQPGRPSPHGEGQAVSSPSLRAFQSAKSRRSSLSSAAPASSPWSMSSGSRFESFP